MFFSGTCFREAFSFVVGARDPFWLVHFIQTVWAQEQAWNRQTNRGPCCTVLLIFSDCFTTLVQAGVSRQLLDKNVDISAPQILMTLWRPDSPSGVPSRLTFPVLPDLSALTLDCRDISFKPSAARYTRKTNLIRLSYKLGVCAPCGYALSSHTSIFMSSSCTIFYTYLLVAVSVYCLLHLCWLSLHMQHHTKAF